MDWKKIKDSIYKNQMTKYAMRFCALMIICALVARGIYAYRLPRIRTANTEKRTISHNVLLDGMTEATSEVAVYTIPNLRVQEICVKEGQIVHQGDILFKIDMTELEKVIEKKEAEKGSLALQVENLKLNEQIKQEQYLEKQQRAREDYETTVENGEQQITQAATDLLTAQQELQQFSNKAAYIEHKKTLDSQLASYKSAKDSAKDKKETLEDKVEKIEHKIDEKKHELSQIDENTGLTQEDKNKKKEEVSQKIAELEKDLEDAENDLEEQKDFYEEAKKNLSSYEKTLENLFSDEWTDKQKSLQKEIENKTQTYQDTITAKQNEVMTANRGVEDASQPEMTDSLLKQNEITLQTMQNEIDGYKEVYQAGGMVYSQTDGMVQKIAIETGGMTPDGAAVTLAQSQEYYDFVATLTKQDKQYVNIGDKAVLSLEKGKIMLEDIEIYAITQGTEKDTWQVYAKIPADKVSWHQSGTLQVTRQSKTYDTCVPLQALVANGNQYECRVLTEKNGFMGLEYAVEMRPVTLLDHNKEFAAIEPLSISDDEKVIIESSRVLQSGDIVRLKDS